MRIIVAIIVYNRFHNIQEWLRAWKSCNTKDSELIVIHNFDDKSECEKYANLCEKYNVQYIPRPNIGMDIGAFQDVCRGRLEGFPNQWDYLLWITDDVFPVSKLFVSKFLAIAKDPEVGAACLEVSREVKLHIRTTGFMISQKVASLLHFPADPVTTKAHCYDFEHRSHNAFYEQIHAMGKKVIQIYPMVRRACLWDTHIRSHFNRWGEFRALFPKK